MQVSSRWKCSFALLLLQTILLLASTADGAGTRLAIGTFGLMPEGRDEQLADLVGVELSGAPGIELLERRELTAMLKEASLGLSGVVRSKDAVRLGTLLRVDQFLLGSSISLNGTNRVVIRLVDAKTGIIRAISVFPDVGSGASLAKEISGFVRAENEHPQEGKKDFLAIGVIQNLGINDRFAGFPAQMRGNLAAKLSGKVTVLERDVISFLADEVRLDMAGLTEQGEAKQMQFGFWIVDGFYQSYEMAEPEVQLRLRVDRLLGKQRTMLLTGKPGESFFSEISGAVEKAMNQAGEIPLILPTRQAEIEALKARGRQLIDFQPPRQSYISPVLMRVAQNPDKVMNALDEATRIYESILLLDPENNDAKMRLAGCLIFETERSYGVPRDHLKERKARAADLYREVIANGDAENANDARITLARSIGGIEGTAMLHQFGAEATDRKERMWFRAFRSELMRVLEHDLPLQKILPQIRNQFFDELSELMENPKEPIQVTFDEVLFGYRFDPVTREQAVNALLPEALEKFPKLKPHILVAAAGEQGATPNSPVSAQFLTELKRCEEHPEAVWQAKSFFTRLSSTLEEEADVRDHGGYTLYQRFFESRQYALVVELGLARQRAAVKGLAPPFTQAAKRRMAESYVALKKWKEALDLFNELPDASVQEKNECRKHLGVVAESEELPESAWKDMDDTAKVALAYQCIARKQLETAIAILKSISPRTVRMPSGGDWGAAFKPVLPAILVDEFRLKAGKPLVKDPKRFELGEQPYVYFTRNSPRFFAFEAEGEDLWIATFSQIKMFRGEGPLSAFKPFELHEFERSTQTATTCIAVSKDYIWAGTYDDGLLELDRKTRTGRRLTMRDGLLVNNISRLKLVGPRLWIAYENGQNGAVGYLDIPSHKFSTFTSTLTTDGGPTNNRLASDLSDDDFQRPPHLPVACMIEGDPGEIWFAVNELGVQRFRIAENKWETPILAQPHEWYDESLAVDATKGLLFVGRRDYGSEDGSKSKTGGIRVYDYRQNKRDAMTIAQGLPSNHVTAIAVDGRVAWVGGLGFVAVVDLLERKVVRIAYVSANHVRRIQLDKTHAWIHITCFDIGDSTFRGDAWTGVYRLARSAIEPALDSGKK